MAVCQIIMATCHMARGCIGGIYRIPYGSHREFHVGSIWDPIWRIPIWGLPTWGLRLHMYISPYGVSPQGFPLRDYFIPGHVGTWVWLISKLVVVVLLLLLLPLLPCVPFVGGLRPPTSPIPGRPPASMTDDEQ